MVVGDGYCEAFNSHNRLKSLTKATDFLVIKRNQTLSLNQVSCRSMSVHLHKKRTH